MAMAAVSSLALVTLTAGCTAGTSTAADPGRAPATPTGTTGQASVQGPGVDLTVTGAVAHLDGAGDGTLTMAVRNEDGVPDHLGMVATPDSGRATLQGGKAADDNGSLDTAGILLLTGTTVTFGGHGPRVLLRNAHGVTSHHTLPVALQFGVAGLVRIQARVAPH